MSAQQYSYKDIDYSLKKSDRKTTSIYIERDGSVSVLAPKPFDMPRIEGVIEKKRSWIYRSLAEWEDLNRTRVHREYVNGESFLYLGRNYRLQIVSGQSAPLLLKNGQFLLEQSAVEDAPKHFRAFYKQKLLNRIVERLPDHVARIGLNPKAYKVQELKNRWGSCTSAGVINIHWKCAMLPLPVLDYVLVHELAHLQYPTHSAAFWRLVERVMPGYEEQKVWLRFNGAGMTL
ncbi:M48 family metallopeptidase [Motiliproteus sp. MSK22-1]|uniref:M48 family metallopeptidase n=1 Tax=Motiliproteus sp. MSK22-1 TaxID=1897630 RepID=UPI0009774D29|nr:SprT family zinc-dependent metalloprotease [Motiliproteus sp. MSK22-1]OMH39418.1 metal-dependent hydrolase [Motiliproteus sp. MSK22-1]